MRLVAWLHAQFPNRFSFCYTNFHGSTVFVFCGYLLSANDESHVALCLQELLAHDWYELLMWTEQYRPLLSKQFTFDFKNPSKTPIVPHREYTCYSKFTINFSLPAERPPDVYTGYHGNSMCAWTMFGLPSHEPGNKARSIVCAKCLLTLGLHKQSLDQSMLQYSE